MSDQAVEAQRRMWTFGDYPVIARHLLPSSIDTVAALDIQPGDRVLDVAAGAGYAAKRPPVGERRVTGIDLTPVRIEKARAR